MLCGFNHPEMPMNAGKTLFAQVMDFVPWKTFGRIVERHRGDAGVRTLSCTELFRILAFAQLTWRESLRDIEACLTANQSKLFHMGMGHIPARSTLADALNLRDWRIYHALAMRLIDRARKLYASKDYPAHLRRIKFNDPGSGKTLVFLTNNMTLPALTIAALYKNRWQVELFFKWIKQHLRIKKFLGTSENAVKTQIWCAVATDVLIAIVKKELQLKASLYTFLQISSVSVFEKTPISCALQSGTCISEPPGGAKQLNLFTF
jgi:transposase